CATAPSRERSRHDDHRPACRAGHSRGRVHRPDGPGPSLMRGWFALVKTTVRSSFRNRPALIFTLLIPIFLMVLLGNVIGGGSASVNICVADPAQTTLSRP